MVPPEFDPKSEAYKGAIKEALTEWLDDKFATFGRWAITSIVAAAFVGLVYLALIGAGWRKG